MQLRALEPSDLNLLFALENDSDFWLSSSTRAPYSRVALKEHIALATRHDIYALRQLRLVAEKMIGERREAVGLVDLIDFSPEHHRAEVGIVVLPQYRRKGYGREILGSLEHYCRTILSLHQLYAYVPATNTASLALFAQSGYTTTAQLEDWLFYQGQYWTTHLLCLKL